jgi:hypothetical protein
MVIGHYNFYWKKVHEETIIERMDYDDNGNMDPFTGSGSARGSGAC